MPPDQTRNLQRWCPNLTASKHQGVLVQTDEYAPLLLLRFSRFGIGLGICVWQFPSGDDAPGPGTTI